MLRLFGVYAAGIVLLEAWRGTVCGERSEAEAFGSAEALRRNRILVCLLLSGVRERSNTDHLLGGLAVTRRKKAFKYLGAS